MTIDKIHLTIQAYTTHLNIINTHGFVRLLMTIEAPKALKVLLQLANSSQFQHYKLVTCTIEYFDLSTMLATLHTPKS